MKILIISGNPLQETFGGVEEHTKHILHALSKISGTNIHFITFGNDDNIFKQDNMTIHRFKRHSITKIFYPFLMPFDAFKIFRKIQKINPEIVHFQGTHPLYCLASVICQRKYPTIITVHGILARELDFHPDISLFNKFFSAYSEKFALYHLKNIIVVAPQIQKIVQTMTKANIYVIPNGIDLDIVQRINPLPKTQENTVLFVGNLVKLKGVSNLIQAISLVKDKIPNVCLLIAGSGPQENELKNLVKTLSIQNNIKFLGFLKGEAKYSYFKFADILVVPSMWESLPIVVLEGMASGKPIIASNIAGIPYLIHEGENGFLVNAGAIDELAEKICVLLQDKSLREQMGKNSIERVKELTWDKIAATTYDQYIQILSDGIKN